MIITIVRKPLVKNVCENITLHNIGGINIDQTRVGTEGGRTNKGGYQNNFVGGKVEYDKGKGVESDHTPKGRWPANVLISHSGAIAIDEQSCVLAKGNFPIRQTTTSMYMVSKGKSLTPEREYGDSGGASRYFKVVKE